MGYADSESKPHIRLPNIDVTMDDLMKKIGKFDFDARIPMQIAVYGDKGTGKTIAAIKMMLATLDEEEILLYIDSAENWSSVMNHPEIMAERDRIIRYPYQNLESLAAWVKNIKENQNHPLIKKIGAVILDEYSSMVQLDLTWITKARADTLLQNSGGKDDSKDPYTPQWPDYRSVEVRFFNIIQGFMHAKPGMSLCMVAHEKYYEKEDKIRASMPSATAADFEKLLHGVYRAYIEEKRVKTEKGYETRRRILFQTAPSGNISAKTRFRVPLHATLDQLIEGYKAWGRNDLKIEENNTAGAETAETE